MKANRLTNESSRKNCTPVNSSAPEFLSSRQSGKTTEATTKVLTFSLGESEINMLDEKTVAWNTSRSALVRIAIRRLYRDKEFEAKLAETDARLAEARALLDKCEKSRFEQLA